jgi:hypothetical protein
VAAKKILFPKRTLICGAIIRVMMGNYEGKRPTGRTRIRRKSKIQLDLREVAQSRVQRQAVVMASIEWIHLHAGFSVSSGSCSHTSLHIVPERTRNGRQPYLFCAVSDCVRLLSCHQTRNVLEITTLRSYERGDKLSTQRQKNVGNKIKRGKRL